ncbi:MAG: glucose-6-phosphate dehydrogenase [Polyangiales bacterium]
MQSDAPPLSISATAPPASIVPQGPLTHGDSCTLIVFGAAGDLSRRKLIPAIHQLAKKGLLGKEFHLLGVGIEKLDDESFRAMMREALEKSDEIPELDEAAWGRLHHCMTWVGGDLTADAVYETLANKLTELERHVPEPRRNRLFYMAVPPVLFGPIAERVSKHHLAPKEPAPQKKPWRRVIVEKPFGHDLKTAQELSAVTLAAFAETQIYRIDHYVGKETVQNVLVLRSANALFEAVWSRQHISHVQITAAETVGVEQRAKYYDSAGVVRDMFQNHLLQLVALTAMEPPLSPDADAVRDEKVKVLRAIKPLVVNGKATAVRAQYAAGELKGAPVPGYRGEPGVFPASITPTYAALRIEVDNERWRGVPFFVRSGKRLAKRVSEIAIHFKYPNQLMYEPVPTETLDPNVLVLRIQPDDGIALKFVVKVPGAALVLTPGIEVAKVEMDFAYEKAFGSESHPAYETLLLDCMIGDPTLFARTDEVEAAWRLTDPLLEHWAKNGDDLASYAAGTVGPSAADDLIAADGFTWRTP